MNLFHSGETSSYRSNPLGLAEFTLSRKDPEYVGRAKAIQAVEKKREELGCFCKADESMKPMMKEIKAKFADREITGSNTGYGSTIFAVKPGDGSAREQAASCQKVLGAGQILLRNMQQALQIQPDQLGYASIHHGGRFRI